jgi:putative ABC transport system permease protein
MFAADPDILGKKVLVRGYPLEVVGVAPEGFGGMNELPEDFWAPLSMIGQLDPDRDRYLRVFGRLRPDFTTAQADAALSTHAQVFTANLPAEHKVRAATIHSRATSVPLSREAILLMTPLIAAFGLVLLIACANVANMMLARAMARQREIGIRLSLGAARSRMIRQLLTEATLLAVPAAALGFAISQAVIDGGVRVLFATLPAEFTEYLRLAPMQPDIRVFAFMMTAALLAAILFGLAPAFQATRASVVQAARGDFSNQHRPSRLRNALVVVQISGCALLLICTGVLLRGANRIHANDTGLDTGHVIEIESPGQSRARVLEALRADPIVDTIAAASQVPFDSPFPSSAGQFRYGSVSPDFFTVFRIPILRGRNFTESEAIAHASVVVVTQSVASHLFPNSDALGQSIHVVKHPDARIIGIARDIHMSVSDRELDRSLVLFPTTPRENTTSLLVRVNGDTEAARQHIDAMLDKAAPGSVDEIHKMEMFVVGIQYIFRVAWWVSAAVGSLALVLAVTGIYGVLSYLVVQRRKEIGIRLAMGASGKQVIGLVLKQSVRLAVIGLTVGAAIGLLVSRIIASRIQAINMFDAVGYALAIVLVFAACLVAGFIPSLRASRIDPVHTLRND